MQLVNVREKTYRHLFILAIAQIMIRVFYLWVDTHIGGTFVGIVSTYAQFIGFALSLLMLLILCRACKVFILAFLAQIIELFGMLCAYLVSHTDPIIEGVNNSLAGKNMAQFFGSWVLALILLAVAIMVSDSDLKKVGFIVFPILAIVGFAYFASWCTAYETQSVLIQSLIETNPHTMLQEAGNNIDIPTLVFDFIFGDEGDILKDILDAAMPKVKESFNDWKLSVILTFVLGIVLNGINIVAYIFLFKSSEELE